MYTIIYSNTSCSTHKNIRLNLIFGMTIWMTSRGQPELVKLVVELTTSTG
jgi:hypothetical protein